MDFEQLFGAFDARLSEVDGKQWMLGLTEALLRYMQKVQPNGDAAAMQVNLEVKKHYGLPLLRRSISGLFESLFEQWCDSQGRGGDSDMAVDGDEEGAQITARLAAIQSLGWFKMHRAEFLAVLQGAIKAHVKETCKDNFEQLFLVELKAWVREAVVPFAEAAVGVVNSRAMAPLLYQSLLQSLAQVRASELFNIVADFPDSMCAVRELKEAVTSPATLGVVGKEFRAAVCKRLLHVGASTGQIVSFYVSMIRALRVMDSSDLLLNYVAAPVRAYLVGRKDTVRCVVSALTEGKGSELHGELKRGGSLEYGADDDDEDAAGADHWEPRKRNLDLAEAGGRGLDVLALLVSIYGSTDLFVSDYRSLLADKLLANLDYRADAELATLELLTIRFGEEALHCCEVMLRDLEESRRINAMLQSSGGGARQGPPTDCLIVSDNYWPALQTDAVALHPTALAAISAYEAAYAQAKKPRKLELVSQLGLVDLSLDFDDGSTRAFLATPVQASLVLHLADASPQSLAALAAKCELEESDVRRRMAFWVSRDVCREYEDGDDMAYAIIEDQRERAAAEASSTHRPLDDPQQAESMTLGSDVTGRAALVQFETYVRGLLTNHGSMTLERIHTMLKLIASGGATGGATKFDMTLLELQRFLQSFVDQDKLECIDGHFRIRSAT